MIELNHKDRTKAEPLNEDELKEVVDILNESIKGDLFDDATDLLQHLISHYENLEHYRAYTEGMKVISEGEAITLSFKA